MEHTTGGQLEFCTGLWSSYSYAYEEIYIVGLDVYHRVVRWKTTDVSEEHFASIFNVEE
jgi:hypothetical protein